MKKVIFFYCFIASSFLSLFGSEDKNRLVISKKWIGASNRTEGCFRGKRLLFKEKNEETLTISCSAFSNAKRSAKISVCLNDCTILEESGHYREFVSCPLCLDEGESRESRCIQPAERLFLWLAAKEYVNQKCNI